MSNVDISLENVLMNDSLGMFFGVPIEKEAATGTVNGTNANFKVTGPIYPTTDVHVIPEAGDVTAYTRKTSVDTAAAVTALLSSGAIDPDTGDEIIDSFTLTTPPATETVDTVHLSYYEQIQPCIMQDISPTLKQTIKEVERMYNAEKLYAYGSIDIKIKSEQVMSEETLNIMRKLLYEDYTSEDGGTVTTGYAAYQMRAKPIPLYGHIPVKYADDLLGIFKLRNCKISPDLPQGKQADTSKFTIEATVPKLPIFLQPTA